MRDKWSISVVIVSLAVLSVSQAGPARADDQADASAVIAKAVKALGGEEKLFKHKALTMKIKGKFYQEGTGYDYTGEIIVQIPDQHKSTINAQINGMAITIISVLNKTKGWTKLNNDVTEMDKDKIADQREEMYAHRVVALVGLKDKAFKLAPVGEVKIGDKDAIGIKVSSKGHRDVNLYFDKKTSLLLKSETTVKQEGTGKEVSQETLYEEYKDIDGTKQARKMKIKQDGKQYVDVDEVSEFKAEEKLDDSTFDKP